MKRIFFFLLISLAVTSYGQDSLSLKYTKQGNRVWLNRQPLSMDDLFDLMRPHPTSFKYIESARDCAFYSNIFFIAGSVPIGYAIGNFLVTNEMKWPILGAGAGLIGVGIPIHFRGKTQKQKAVNCYNKRFDLSGSFHRERELSFVLAPQSIGLVIKL